MTDESNADEVLKKSAELEQAQLEDAELISESGNYYQSVLNNKLNSCKKMRMFG